MKISRVEYILYILIYLFIYSILDVFTMLSLGTYHEITHFITCVISRLYCCKLITLVVIATQLPVFRVFTAVLLQAHYPSSYSNPATSFQGFYSYLYSSGAYPARVAAAKYLLGVVVKGGGGGGGV